MQKIRDKINSELRNRFSQEIIKTIESGKERGFLICVDEKDRLSATESCEGKECDINLAPLQFQCNFKIQGEFHTHPHASDVKKYLGEKLGRKISLEDAKIIIKDIAKENKISLTEPSYGDLLGVIASRYTGDTLGTTCIGTDIEPNRVECWTTRKEISAKVFDLVTNEFLKGGVGKPPLKWARELFEKEIIELK